MKIDVDSSPEGMDLPHAYADAWQEWGDSSEAHMWEIAAGDALAL